MGMDKACMASVYYWIGKVQLGCAMKVENNSWEWAKHAWLVYHIF